MIDDNRMLAHAMTVWSFQLAGGEDDWFPDTLIFGPGGSYGAIGDDCVITTREGTNWARVYSAVSERGGEWFELPALGGPRLQGARLPKLVASQDCGYVAVAHEATATVYNTRIGSEVFELASGDGEFDMLRTHVVGTHGEPVALSRLADGARVAVDFETSLPLAVAKQSHWRWIEPRGRAEFMALGVETRAGYRFDPFRDEAAVVLWTVREHVGAH